MSGSVLRRALGGWRRDERGASLVELLLSAPLLAGAMLITTNYGVSLSQTEALEAATRDAVRLIGRAPAAIGSDAEGMPVPLIYEHFVDSAREMIATRMEVPESAVTLAHSVDRIPGSESLRNPFYLVTVEVAVEVPRPLGADVVLATTESGRYLSEIALGAAACARSERGAGAC